MDALFVPVVLSFTVVASVAFGILAAYVAVTGILQAFASRTPARPTARPRLVLVPTQSHASGD